LTADSESTCTIQFYNVVLINECSMLLQISGT